MSKPRISYVDPSTIDDPVMIAEFERCAREGTPRPESQAIRAHVPATFWSFANTWRDFVPGVPMSFAGLVWGVIGFAGGWVVAALPGLGARRIIRRRGAYRQVPRA